MAHYIESGGGSDLETEPLLDTWLNIPSTSGYEQRKKVNESNRFVFPDHGTFLAYKPDMPELEEAPMDNPTTVALDKCERLVMRPYTRLLTLIAWQPLFDNPDRTWQSFLNVFHPTVIILFTLFGYVIQYAACFRRDQAGDGRRTVFPWDDLNGTVTMGPVSPSPPVTTGCQSYIISQYIFPDVLHSAAYLYSFIVFRILKSEQLPTLMERVFLQTSPTQSGFLSQGRLIRRLRLLFWLSIVWVLASLSALVVHMVSEYQDGALKFSFFEPKTVTGTIILMILMGVSLTVLDIVYVAVILNYSVQCQLLLSYINGLVEKIRERSQSLEEFIKDIDKIHEHLRFLNRHPGTAATIVMINFGTMTITGFLAFLDKENNNFNILMYISTGANVLLWFSIMAVPIIYAARVTAACNTLSKVGHEIRTRPFGYEDETIQDLDSFLLYTSNLRMKAKMFLIPVRSSYLCGLLVVFVVTLMLLFQTGVLRIWL